MDSLRSITCRAIQKGEEAAVCRLVLTVFDATVAPDFSTEGVAEFRHFADAKALEERLRQGNSVLLAERAGRLIGIVEIMENRHIAMLFVDPAAQGRGVGRALLSQAIELCRTGAPDLTELTVHSAPGAVHFYEKHGFRVQGLEREENGIRYLPMVIRLK